MEIKVTCDGTDYVDYRKLTPLQGDLKTITDENLDKLKKSIIKYGFTAPGFVWKSGKTMYVIDSHQRIKALDALFSEGWTIPDIPIVYIQAKTKKEAKEKLLHITSQYGQFTEGGYLEFLNNEDLDLSLIRLMSNEFTVNYKEDDVIEDFKEYGEDLITTNTCPKCGYQW